MTASSAAKSRSASEGPVASPSVMWVLSGTAESVVVSSCGWGPRVTLQARGCRVTAIKLDSVASNLWSRGEMSRWSCLFCCDSTACVQCGGLEQLMLQVHLLAHSYLSCIKIELENFSLISFYFISYIYVMSFLFFFYF